ncbi:hypothetical protein [Paraburkholderia sp. DHOC27]|nr:hypothetical protein [Paraburkholderia sp. DHOC27]
MKRFVWVAMAVVPLVCGVGACKKAHEAGNDSMKPPASHIVASARS